MWHCHTTQLQISKIAFNTSSKSNVHLEFCYIYILQLLSPGHKFRNYNFCTNENFHYMEVTLILINNSSNTHCRFST